MITNFDQVKELKACKNNPVHFINRYIKFYDTQENKQIDLQLWDFQEEYASAFYTDRFILALKSRQLGFTTVTLALALHEALFHKNVRIVIMAQTENDASNLLNNIKYMFQYLPEWMKPQVGRDNTSTLEFPKLNSSISVQACSPRAGRSIQATHIILDEFAFYNVSRKSMDEDIYTAIYPTVSRGGRLTIISTPNGVGNYFHTLVSQAISKDNDFRLFQLMWNVRKDRDQAWYEQTLRQLGPKKFAQEYECSFLQSGKPIFQSSYLKVATTRKPAVSGHRYAIGADPAEGLVDGDYSVGYVIDLDTLEQVEEIRGHYTPDVFAEMLDSLGRRYCDAIVGVERNNHGHTVLLRLAQLQYPNIYRDDKGKAGWLTTGTSKPIMIDDLEEALRNEEVKISSHILLSELQAYQDLGGGQSGAPSSMHDDCVMAMALAFQMRRRRTARAWGPGHRPAGL